MYYWRIFLWKDGGKSTEYTDYTVAPIFLEDKLDETLDTGEIILKCMPIATKNAFPPKTKFRLERYLTAECTDTPKTWDMIVEHDDVEEYEGCPEICTHRVHLIEASVIAQGMHVDNIALTYELQDVTLNYKTIKSATDSVKDLGLIDAQERGNAVATHTCPKMSSVVDEVRAGKVATISFTNSYRYIWTGLSSIEALKGFYFAETAKDLSFTLPTLTAQGAKNGGWIDICELPVEASVVLDLLDANNNVITTQRIDRKYGPSSFPEDSTDKTIYQYGQEATFGGVSRKLCFATAIKAFASQSSKLAGLVTSIDDLTEFDESLNSLPITPCWISYIDTNYNNSKSVNITIPRLTEAQMRRGEKYRLLIIANVATIQNVGGKNVLPAFYECKCDVGINQSGNFANNTAGLFSNSYQGGGYTTTTNAGEITFSVAIFSQDQRQTIMSYEFMRQKEKYNCYDLLRKAIMTCDTHVISDAESIDNILLPIEASAETKTMLTATQIHETIFEQKNLWEILLQIGYYIHSIPYLEFASDGDYFILKFERLGNPTVKEKTSNKITVFNSLNLSDYFTQYDSYVTNMYSPQNVIDEYGVVKTSSTDYLVSNNSAEIHTKYNIIELLQCEIKQGDSGEWSDITKHIFEEAVYSSLTSYANITPSKGNSLYYSLGNNKILGLSYVPQTPNGDVPLYAFKEIIKSATGDYSLYNEYKYHIKYRTQDALRISQFRPDIHKFMKNSSREKYPHHEQYFGQQEKITDSERFSANLFGKLVRVGNAIYQQQEYATDESEKVSGDLIEINGEPYYVTAVENEYYADTILQKVTYSKNFNQLSNIVTIPSEPRFYEVSERSKIRREVRLNDFLLLTTQEPPETRDLAFADKTKWSGFIKCLVFGENNTDIPNYAYLRFKGDRSKYDEATYKTLFPSSETYRIDQNTVAPKDSKPYSDIAVPILGFPIKNAIVFEWDMDDNFKAGDFINSANYGGDGDDAYYTMQSARYCDIFGGADLFDFSLFMKDDWTQAEIRKLPIIEKIPTKIFGTKTNQSVVLNKDNREALSFNYQINLLQDSREFITCSNLFGKKNGRLRMCFLTQEVGYLSEAVELSDRTIAVDNIEYSAVFTGTCIEITITQTATDDVKAIVLYEYDENKKYPCIVRNVAKYGNTKKSGRWYIYPAFIN